MYSARMRTFPLSFQSLNVIVLMSFGPGCIPWYVPEWVESVSF